MPVPFFALSLPIILNQQDSIHWDLSWKHERTGLSWAGGKGEDDWGWGGGKSQISLSFCVLPNVYSTSGAENGNIWAVVQKSAWEELQKFDTLKCAICWNHVSKIWRRDGQIVTVKPTSNQGLKLDQANTNSMQWDDRRWVSHCSFWDTRMKRNLHTT